MKKIIKFLLLLLPFFLSGCAKVEYNLTIDKDLKVLEEVNISATSEFFNRYYKNLPINVVKQNYESSWINPIKENGYFHELRKDNTPYPSVFVKKEYDNLDDYTINTVFKGQSFEDITFSNTGDLVTLRTIDFIKYAPDDGGGSSDYRFNVSDLTVSIKLPFYVTDNNADKVNKKENIYVWEIDEKTEDKEIKLTFDKTKKYTSNLVLYILIVVLVVFFIILGIYIKKIYINNKRNNRL